MNHKMFTVRAVLVLISLSFFFNLTANAVVTYTQMDEVIDDTGFTDGAWSLDQNVGSAPANSVAEILVVNTEAILDRWMGVRNTSSTQNRYIQFGEAESSGGTVFRFLVQVDGSGNADFYTDELADSHFLLVGYWEGVSFKGQWVSYDVTNAEDDMWHTTDGTELSLQASRVHLITVTNDDTGKEQVGGVRNTTSTLNRYVDIMEAESDGYQGVSMFVQSDASSMIEVWSEQTGDIIFYNQGYFDSDEITFSENWVDVSHAVDDTWTDVDLSAYLDEDGRVADIILLTSETGTATDIGARKDGTADGRVDELTRAEGGGYSCMGMTAETSASGVVEIYFDDATYCVSYLEGYFIWDTTSPWPNNASLNYALSITDMDDTDNLYSEKKYYNLDYDGYDLDGYANVSLIKIYVNASVTSRAIFQYNEDTDTFSLISGDWEIDTGASSASKAGTDLNLTFLITPSWDAIEEADLELEAMITDGASTDHDLFQTDYADVITTLLTSAIECTDGDTPDRVNVAVNSQVDFSVRYADNPASGTPSNDYPPDAEFTSISIYDSLNNNEGSDSSIVNGDGSVSFSEATVQSETYNLYIDMNDADYTDAEITTPTETIIWDRIKILSLGANDPRIDINTVGTWWATAELEYDSHALGAGDSFTLSSEAFSWNGTYFEATDNKATSQQVLINAFDSGSEATYGITVGNINGLSQGIIWDRLLIAFNVDDTTPYSGVAVKFTVDISYEYDAVNCTTYIYDVERNGTLYVDDYAARSFTDNQVAPTKYVYDFEGASESLYGLSAYLDDDDITVQWFVLVQLGEVNLLFGAGFNHSTPYVIIRWNYSGNVDNYEIFHSPDNITYTSLALTPNKNYNHTGLVNGTLHYYRVRSTFFTLGTWYNSSLSPINLERVWFLHGAGGAGGGVNGLLILFIASVLVIARLLSGGGA